MNTSMKLIVFPLILIVAVSAVAVFYMTVPAPTMVKYDNTINSERPSSPEVFDPEVGTVSDGFGNTLVWGAADPTTGKGCSMSFTKGTTLLTSQSVDPCLPDLIDNWLTSLGKIADNVREAFNKIGQ